MIVSVAGHMDRPRVKSLGGSGAGMLFDGVAEEWGGRGGKENMGGGGDDPIVVPRNAHDGDRGVLFSDHDLSGNLKMMEQRRVRASRRL